MKMLGQGSSLEQEEGYSKVEKFKDCGYSFEDLNIGDDDTIKW
jgi:hypothetical protein